MTLLDPPIIRKPTNSYSTFPRDIEEDGNLSRAIPETVFPHIAPITTISQPYTRILYRPRETWLWIILFLVSIVNSIWWFYDLAFLSRMFFGPKYWFSALVFGIGVGYIVGLSILWDGIRNYWPPTIVTETEIGQSSCGSGKREIALQWVCLGSMILYWMLSVYGEREMEWYPWKDREQKMTYYTVVCTFSTLGLYLWVCDTPVVAERYSQSFGAEDQV